MTELWQAGSATGIGSMPGTDPGAAMRMVAGELEGFPYLPELPGRGPGADLTGRTAALLVEMPAEITPRGWRLTERPGRDIGRAASMLASDLDALEEVLQGYTGPLKIQLCGPWTLAATIELHRTMDAVLRDPGAVRDLTESLAEGAAGHVADVRSRVPGARLVVQIDEPALGAVADGRVPTASGISRLRAIEADTLAERLGRVIAATGEYVVIHCCDAGLRYETIRRAGARGISFDLSQLRRGDEDALAELAEAGLGLFAGAASTASTAGGLGNAGAGPSPKETAERVLRLWRRMGVPPRAEQTVVTPGCGLAGSTPEQARGTLRLCREAAAIVPELIEEAE